VLSIVHSLPPILQVCIALAALHNNDNSKKSVAKTKHEQFEYSIKIPKFKKKVVTQFMKFVITVLSNLCYTIACICNQTMQSLPNENEQYIFPTQMSRH
jgi:hypothetical protein